MITFSSCPCLCALLSSFLSFCPFIYLPLLLYPSPSLECYVHVFLAFVHYFLFISSVPVFFLLLSSCISPSLLYSSSSYDQEAQLRSYSYKSDLSCFGLSKPAYHRVHIQCFSDLMFYRNGCEGRQPVLRHCGTHVRFQSLQC